MELSNNKSDGVEILRKILLDILKKNKENNVNISYLGAPKYRITVNSSDFKTAEKTLKPVLEEIEKYVNKIDVEFLDRLQGKVGKMTKDDIIYSVPLAEDNTDYQEIQTWVADGNTIESAD